MVNLNSLNFPDSKNNNNKVFTDRQYSFDLKTQNKKNLIKSKDINNIQINATNPYVSKTHSGFYNIKDTGQLPNNVKLLI